ncbi:MAG: HlyD family efflux transporter periplasmic adaptor subunit ['Candidatus Kapabacteria' thiocyanatum]|uniref:HlyD family secretion protein n=1 Tax=Candidatus Kapaibacterium thiocyanatum TaxID=1895771 RepID=A0A1M3L679_9BACT|nr:HlyD family efflux transporter periplasmic adaptor subunit ['Candidatus Kapabacteria' thiocyanatum]OJX61077.1 MAG: HlyD family secretion protein ['Candidatus Kapabacteria' thiocyanatum]
MFTKFIMIVMTASIVVACGNGDNDADAAGTFETEEVIVSSQATGLIERLDIEEGQTLVDGQDVGYVDTTQLDLKKKQLVAQIDAVLSRKPQIATQIAALREQLVTAERELQRVTKLVQAEAATTKQLDDARAQVAVLEKQIDAQYSTLGISSQSITQEAIPLRVQIEQLDDQIAKSRIVNRIPGTVLTKYAQAQEVTAVGKPLYRIGDLSTVTLRAYVTGNQFSSIRLNQNVRVLVDDGQNGYREYSGTISWISDKAEFTPKTIQTKDERANLVYAVKVRVKNDGRLKIGMYGEVRFK